MIGIPIIAHRSFGRLYDGGVARERRHRRGGRGFGSLGLAVDQLLQLLAGLEVGHLLRRHVHLVAGLRVAALARLALPQAEAAEPAQLDLLPAMQRIDDALEHRVDDDLGMLLGEVGDPRDFLDELRLRHAAGTVANGHCAAPSWASGPRNQGPAPRASPALSPEPRFLGPLSIPKVIAERRRAGTFALLVRVPVGAELLALERADAEAELPFLGAQLDDLHLVVLAHLEIDLLAAARRLRVVEFRHVNQPLDSLVELDESAEVRHPRDLALDGAPDLVPREEVIPDVGGELLQAERQPLILGVDAEHHRLDHVALLQHLRRMLDPLAPRHVGDVNQAVDVLFDLDERAELGEVTDLALDLGAARILLRQLVPRVALDPLQPERNRPRRRIDAEHHRLDVVADVEDLRRVLHALAPRHLGDVDQAFDARLELDERAVVGQADDLAAHARADRVAVLHRRPRVLHQLFVTERDALGRRVVLQHRDVDFVVDLEQLRGMADAAPRHVGDVQQAVDAAEVDERAVVGDVLDRAAELLARGERLGRRLLLLGVLLLEERLARQHDVAALLVDLDHAHAQLLPAQRVEIADRPHVDLRAGEERADADVHGEAALDALDDAADDHLLVGVGLLDLVPDLHLLGLLARQHDVAFTIFGALEQHVDGVALLHGHVAVLVEKLVNRDETFGLVPHVDDDVALGDFQHRALDHFALRHVAEAVVIGFEHGRKFLRVHVLVLHRFKGGSGRFPRAGPSRYGGLSPRLGIGKDCPVVYVRH